MLAGAILARPLSLQGYPGQAVERAPDLRSAEERLNWLQRDYL